MTGLSAQQNRSNTTQWRRHPLHSQILPHLSTAKKPVKFMWLRTPIKKPRKRNAATAQLDQDCYTQGLLGDVKIQNASLLEGILLAHRWSIDGQVLSPTTRACGEHLLWSFITTSVDPQLWSCWRTQEATTSWISQVKKPTVINIYWHKYCF